MATELSRGDQALLSGSEGEAARFAMQTLLQVAEVQGASRLVSISQAHLVGAYASGGANIRFLDKLLEGGARVRVRTTLNASSSCLAAASPSDPDERSAAREVVNRYREMGCEQTLTCAPYYLPDPPQEGDCIAWAESNAVTYANSVLGAHTNKTTQYLDLCAAITGRIPESGLYLPHNRQANLLVICDAISDELSADPATWQLLGLFLGWGLNNRTPALAGLPPGTDNDDLRALGAAANCSGNLPIFHALGHTPEAMDDSSPALRELGRSGTFLVKPQHLERLSRRYKAHRGEEVTAVCLGTPHFSEREFEEVLAILERQERELAIPVYITTSRYIRGRLQSRLLLGEFTRRGITVLTDSCTYYGKVVPGLRGTVTTNSAKWAFYAGGNLGVKPHLTNLEGCLEVAATGHIPWEGSHG